MPATLRRSLSLPLLILYGLGTILGAGIYVLVGEVAGAAGAFAPLSFVLAAALATLTGLSYGELAARFPESAGEAIYVYEGFSSRHLSAAVGLLIVLTGIASAATIAVGFAEYATVFFDIPDALATSFLLVVLGLVAAVGIDASVRAAAIMTVVEIIGLLIVVFVAGDKLGDIPDRAHELWPGASAEAWQGIAIGAFLAFYAFIGFEDIVNVAEEAVDPERSMPVAIMVSVLVSTVLYTLVALVCVLTLDPGELAASDAPLAVVYERATGRAPVLITGISMIAVANGALVQIIMGARVLFGLGRRGWLPGVLAKVHPRTQTPLLATLLITAAIAALALTLPLATLAQLASFIILGVFAVVNLALFRIKRRDRVKRRLPIWVPAVGALATLGLLIGRLASW